MPPHPPITIILYVYCFDAFPGLNVIIIVFTTKSVIYISWITSFWSICHFLNVLGMKQNSSGSKEELIALLVVTLC
jgi:hypothetical protein